MSHIKISVPNYDEAALHYFGEAMIKLAAYVRGESPVSVRVEPLTVKADKSVKERLHTEELTQTTLEIPKGNDVDTAAQQVQSTAIPVEANGATYETNLGSDNPVPVCVADSTGTPWDERIHSASKALNSDGTWRVRRKPADKTPEEWADYIKWVEEDIHTAQHGQSEESFEQLVQKCSEEAPKILEGMRRLVDEMHEPPVTPAGDDFHVDAGEVTEQEVASIPAPPPPPVFATVQEVDEMLGLEPSYTFPQVMQFLTERHGRITSPQVDQIIADMGLNSIMDIRDNTEHAGPFIARVKALLGE